ncbi:hypothetical protein PsorP6_000747 [Peronosclerospora sorghi]|uniref:Uncharacterized protein n=2 Tax=Peronosclerospora sorghi TaxID=230839 RepID=A0ACC0VY05_9STRA|nr:hypothetical protein PsorP6_010778 [Peronosclerospora sorghi]KAI9921923.1 hypothetical protein PsorP6_000747 [Peronosclerospora sorghi]
MLAKTQTLEVNTNGLAELRELQVFHTRKFRVAFILRVDEKLNFSLLELTHTQESSTRRDLIAKSATDLGAAEGNLASIVF